MAESVGSGNSLQGTGWRQPAAGARNAAQIGHLVSSIKGRDRGKFYLVVGIESQSMVRVADGEARKVENPKRKNIKHLNFFEVIAGEVSDKALSGKRITNADIRKELKSLAAIINKCSS